MDILFELAALPPDDSLAPEEDMFPIEEPVGGLVLLSVLSHALGLLGYFGFPLVCLRLIRACATQRLGWKNASASAAIGIILAFTCQTAVGLLLYFPSLHSRSLNLDGNAFMVFSAGLMAGRYLGPLLLSVPVFPGLRKLPRIGRLTPLASGFGRAYLLLFLVPYAGFMLFQDYAKLPANPEYASYPAALYPGFGLAAVPAFFLLLRSLARQAKTVPRPCVTVAAAAFIVIPLFPIPAWLFSLLYYAGQYPAALWPDTFIQTLVYGSVALLDPLWIPLLTALASAGVLRLCAGRAISVAQGMLGTKIVFLLAASIYVITACRFFLYS